MLSKLYIRNYTIIDEIFIEPDAGLTVITGETGAGKSVILGALSLLLGQRAEAGLINNPANKCIIEGSFFIKAYHFENLFKESGLDYDEQTIIRREILPNGKSRAFINDSPVTLDILKLIGKELIDIHKQFDTQALRAEHFQLLMLDSVANHAPLLAEYSEQFQHLRELKRRLLNTMEKNRKAEQDKDYITFQINELDQANLLDANELVSIEKEKVLLDHAAQIQTAFAASINMLDQDERSATKLLIDSLRQLETFKSVNPDFETLVNRLDSIQIELADLVSELQQKLDKTESDPNRLELLEERYNLLNQLLNKHHKNDLQSLINLKNGLQQQLKSINNLDVLIAELEENIEEVNNKLFKLATRITSNRAEAATRFETYVNNMLPEAAMPEGRFSVLIEAQEQYTAHGKDVIRFSFTANKGKPLQDLGKIASGGELSRLMLIMKSMIAKSTALPSLVFDEIDSGISGEAGIKISHILKKLSQNHQVICITHLPQIAGQGDQHLYIYKEIVGDTTVARARKLGLNERIQELAEMLSGKTITSASIKNAKALMFLQAN